MTELDKLINRRSYLWVSEFLKYLFVVRRLTESSIKRYKSYLRNLLIWSGEIPLNHAHMVKQPFTSYVNQRTYSRGNIENKSLDLQTQKKIIITSRMFFRWAKDYHEKEFAHLPGYWINDLVPPKVFSNNDAHKYVKLDEILQIASLPEDWDNLAFMRDRAAACLLFLSGMRCGAFASLPLEAINLSKMEVYQWPKEFHVRTKNKKRETTTLLMIPKLLKIVTEWDNYLRSQVPKEQWSTFLWYPPIQSNWGEMKLSFDIPGKNRYQALNKRLRRLFRRAKLEYKSAHKFRHGHAVYGVERCTTMAEYQALSRNLMHQSINITDEIYAGVELRERKQLIARLTTNLQDQSDDQLAVLLKSLGKKDLIRAITVAVEKLSCAY